MINAGEFFTGGLQAAGSPAAKASQGGTRESGGSFDDLLRQAMDEPAQERAKAGPESAARRDDGGQAGNEELEDADGPREKAVKAQEDDDAAVAQDGEPSEEQAAAQAARSEGAGEAAMAEWVHVAQPEEAQTDEGSTADEVVEAVRFEAPDPQTDQGAGGDGAGDEPEAPQQAGPAAPAEAGGAAPTAFELLDANEALDPTLRVEATPGRLLERLQQSVGTAAGAAVAEEAAEVVLPQVVRSVATLVRDGLAEMRLQLQPGDLGHIEVRVKAAEGAVRAELMVQQGEVKQLLESQAEKLRAALSQQGLELEGFDVDLSGGRGNGRQAESAWEQASASNGRGGSPVGGGAEAASAGPAPVLAPTVGGGGEVDYLA